MRRSQQVSAPLLASVAVAALTACRQPELQRCVDEQNHVVQDSLCQNQPREMRDGSYYFRPFGYTGYTRWYYGGYGGYVPGTIVGGGGYAPLSGHSYASSTSRGGFGSSHASGGHGGEGGGE